MRVALLVVGTRGDLVPVVALARGLRDAGHVPVIATSADHRALVSSHEVEFSSLLPSYVEGIDRDDPALARAASAGIGLLRRRMIDAACSSWADDGRRVVEGADLVIGVATSMSAVADALGERFGVDVVHAHLMPLLPSRHVPPPLPPPGRRTLPQGANIALFRAMRLLVWRSCFAEAVRRLRAQLGLAPATWAPRDPRAPLLCGWSPALLPRPPDWDPTRVAVTGAWELRGGTQAVVDPRVERFLADDGPPMYVGFGSMHLPAEARQVFREAVREGVRRSGMRALLGGAMLEGLADGESSMIEAGATPYAWLFPRVSVAVHHGGSGGTHDAARVGTPQVVVPFVVDQFLWAQRLHRADCAPWRLNRRRLAPDAVATAIRAAASMRAGSARLANAMASEDGVGVAIARLKAWGVLR